MELNTATSEVRLRLRSASSEGLMHISMWNNIDPMCSNPCPLCPSVVMASLWTGYRIPKCPGLQGSHHDHEKNHLCMRMQNETSLVCECTSYLMLCICPSACSWQCSSQNQTSGNSSMRIRCHRHLPPRPVPIHYSLLNGSLPAVGCALIKNLRQQYTCVRPPG